MYAQVKLERISPGRDKNKNIFELPPPRQDGVLDFGPHLVFLNLENVRFGSGDISTPGKLIALLNTKVNEGLVQMMFLFNILILQGADDSFKIQCEKVPMYM